MLFGLQSTVYGLRSHQAGSRPVSPRAWRERQPEPRAWSPGRRY